MATADEKLAAIQAIERDGRVDPNVLIQHAKDPMHPCHGDFTWDVEAAARERWLDQARSLIRSFRFEVEVEDRGPVSVAYYVPVGSKETGSEYQRTSTIRRKADVSTMFVAEVRALHGLASRVLGIAEAKRSQIGDEKVETLNTACRMLGGLIDE